MRLRYKIASLIAGLMIIMLGVRPSPAPSVMADSGGNLLTPLFFLLTNLTMGSNMFATYSGGKLTISAINVETNVTTTLLAASNALVTLETTRNAAVSNSVVAEIITASNSLYSTETTRNAAVSNALVAHVTASTNIVAENVGWVQITNNAVFRFNTSDFIATNSTVNSNITINVDVNSRYLYVTNSISLTNVSGLASGKSGSCSLLFVPQAVNRTVVYPNLGWNNPGFGYRVATNANNTLWTTLTNGVGYVLSVSFWDTNMIWTLIAMQ